MSQPQTIPTKFDPKSLPAWAGKEPAVAWLAERDLSFRVNVFDAKMPDYKRALVKQAKHAYENRPTT